jgi:hypothetical protein
VFEIQRKLSQMSGPSKIYVELEMIDAVGTRTRSYALAAQGDQNDAGRDGANAKGEGLNNFRPER